MSAKEDLLARLRAMTPEERKAATTRVLHAIFSAPVEEPEEDIDNMTPEQVTEYLRSHGYNVEELHQRLNQRVEEINRRFETDKTEEAE